MLFYIICHTALYLYKCIDAIEIVDIKLGLRRLNILERLALLITIPWED